jgi:hypothetical protein
MSERDEFFFFIQPDRVADHVVSIQPAPEGTRWSHADARKAMDRIATRLRAPVGPPERVSEQETEDALREAFYEGMDAGTSACGRGFFGTPEREERFRWWRRHAGEQGNGQCTCPDWPHEIDEACVVAAAPELRQVSEASALRELEAHVGLHEGVEITWLVDEYEAALTTHDGASVRATGEGETIADAIAALCRALEDTKGATGED